MRHAISSAARAIAAQHSLVTRAVAMVIGLVMLVVGAGCHWVAPSYDAGRRELTVGWKGHHGDSPRDADGKLVWLASNDEGWHSVALPDYTTSDDSFLWLRIPLPSIDARDPAVLIDTPLTMYEAYVDDVLVDRFGNVEDEQERWFGLSPRMVRLPENASGRRLSLRIRSTLFKAGIPGRVFVGERATLLHASNVEELPRFITGMSLVFLGLATLVVGLRRKEEDRILTMSFGALMMGTGAYALFYTRLASFVFDSPRILVVVHDVAMHMAFISTLVFVATAFGNGWRQILRKLWRFHLVAIAVYVVARLPTETIVAPWKLGFESGLRLLFLIEVIAVVSVVASRARQRDRDAIVFAIGLLPAVVSSVRDILAAFRVVSFSWDTYSVVGVVSTAAALLVIVQRRHEATVARLAGELKVRVHEKERILKDLHDGIGGITTNIGLIAEMASRSDDEERRRRAVREIADLSRDGMQDLRNVLDGLDESELAWPRLVGQLRHLGGQALDPHDIALELDDDLDPEAAHPTSILFVHVMRTFREAITNAIKHANPTKVSAQITVSKDAMTLSVLDDGRGIDETGRRGRGLDTMRSRAQELNGTLTVKDRGILMHVPLPPTSGVSDARDVG